MKQKSICAYFLMSLWLPFVSWAQHSPYAGEMRKISAIIKNTKDISYKFYMTGEFPNGDRDKLSGTVYIGTKDKLIYNSNDAFTLVYNDKWFYKADHLKKEVTIVNVQKHVTKEERKGMTHDFLEGGMINYYFDSVVMQYATVRKLKRDEDTVRIELTFPYESSVKSLQMSYNDKARQLTSYRLYLFEPWPTSEFGKDKGTNETIVCWDFKKEDNIAEYKPEYFFSVKNNKATLKKFETYTLNTKL